MVNIRKKKRTFEKNCGSRNFSKKRNNPENRPEVRKNKSKNLSLKPKNGLPEFFVEAKLIFWIWILIFQVRKYQHYQNILKNDQHYFHFSRSFTKSEIYNIFYMVFIILLGSRWGSLFSMWDTGPVTQPSALGRSRIAALLFVPWCATEVRKKGLGSRPFSRTRDPFHSY